jgi:N-formylglutamate deformylase
MPRRRLPSDAPLPPLGASVVREPGEARVPLVVDSPHSGMTWPTDFQPSAPRQAILTTWDAHVDELWSGAVTTGAALLAAHFPRAYVDVNRAPGDLDRTLVDGPWPEPVEESDYTRRGMGLIRRLALPDVPMYDAPLPRAAVRHRLATYYRPYRDLLGATLERTRRRFGVVCHLNCHSMKSRGNRMNVDEGAARPDIVLSDRLGTTAAPALTTWVAAYLSALGYAVQINRPYQGGDLVATFGRPERWPRRSRASRAGSRRTSCCRRPT